MSVWRGCQSLTIPFQKSKHVQILIPPIQPNYSRDVPAYRSRTSTAIQPRQKVSTPTRLTKRRAAATQTRQQEQWAPKDERVWAPVTEVGWGEFTANRALNLVLTDGNIEREGHVTLCIEKTAKGPKITMWRNVLERCSVDCIADFRYYESDPFALDVSHHTTHRLPPC